MGIVDKRLPHIDAAFSRKLQGQSSHDLWHNTRANPLLKAPMTGPERWVSVGKIRPGRTDPQYPQDAANDGAAAFPRPPAAVGSCSWLWN